MNDRAYWEKCVYLPVPEKGMDLYQIHQRVLAIVDGHYAASGIMYAPGKVTEDGVQVILRSGQPQESFTENHVEVGTTLNVVSAARFIKRFGGQRKESMPDQREAILKWDDALLRGGFQAGETEMEVRHVDFYHPRQEKMIRLPFWAVKSEVTVMDAEKAAATMVRGVGRSRGLGFGMLILTV